MFVVIYKTKTKGLKIHGPKTGVLGVIESDVISVMDNIVMDAIEHPYGNPFHDGFEIQNTFASITSSGSALVVKFGIRYKNDKGEEVNDFYIAEWVDKLG